LLKNRLQDKNILGARATRNGGNMPPFLVAAGLSAPIFRYAKAPQKIPPPVKLAPIPSAATPDGCRL
jgi:hypothetical protein